MNRPYTSIPRGVPAPRLMLVTDRHATRGRDLVEVALAAVAGGVDAVQIREKDLPDTELLRLAERLQWALSGRAVLLVNGRPAVARALGLGLHLPADAPDLPTGGWPLWGRSVHSVDEARAQVHAAPDYLLLGTVFPTSSKPGRPGGGLTLVEEVVRAVGPLPVLAIGGITAENVGVVIAAGAAGVAVRSAILEAPDPQREAERIRLGLLAKGALPRA